jgi:hypothetical protein
MSERDPFADDVLRRLVASNREYQNEHGYYIVPLAQRLLDTRAELEQAEKERDEWEEVASQFGTRIVQAERRAIENGRLAQKHWDRAEQAEKERDRLREFLAEIES